MTFDRPHYYLTWGGTQLSGAEIWQTGSRWMPGGGVTADDLLNELENNVSLSDIFDDLKAVIGASAVGQRYATHQHLLWVKCAVIDTDEHYAGPPSIFEGDQAGTLAAANAAPPQLAMVVSLNTGSNFGKAQRGRQYWPLPADFTTAVNTTTGQIPAATANTFRDTVDTALTAVEGELSTLGVPVSLAIMSPSGTGTSRIVTEIGVGTVIDTQRRRRNALVDAKTYAPASVLRRRGE